MKRRGETFTEFLVATAVFGIMMGGLFEFMANQSETLSDIRNRDAFMYYAQKYADTLKNPPKDPEDTASEINKLKQEAKNRDNIAFKLTNDNKRLIVAKVTGDNDEIDNNEIASMDFTIRL